MEYLELLDITKPGIINRAQDFKNGVGVVLDDFLAGVIGNLILAIIVGILWHVENSFKRAYDELIASFIELENDLTTNFNDELLLDLVF